MHPKGVPTLKKNCCSLSLSERAQHHCLNKKVLQALTSLNTIPVTQGGIKPKHRVNEEMNRGKRMRLKKEMDMKVEHLKERGQLNILKGLQYSGSANSEHPNSAEIRTQLHLVFTNELGHF